MIIHFESLSKIMYKKYFSLLFIIFVFNSLCTAQQLKGSFYPISLPFFPLVYTGNGIGHMNINLVNLKDTGLKEGDEIGVFDSIYCVGSKIITERDIADNGLSIPASANNTFDAVPNGFIEDHKITLKVYRSGTVYLLNFQLVNDSQNRFEQGGSMFALIDFAGSTKLSNQSFFENTEVYPNPFSDLINIEINNQNPCFIHCDIINLEGEWVKTLFNGQANSFLRLFWNGKDKNEQPVSSGIYLCRTNEITKKIIFSGNPK